MASSSNLIELIASYLKLDLFSKRLWGCNVTRLHVVEGGGGEIWRGESQLSEVFLVIS